MFVIKSSPFFKLRVGSLSTNLFKFTFHLTAKYGTKGALPEVPKEVASAKKPFKVTLEEGKKYSWCACGHAKTALCDGTHKDQTLNIKERPVKFTVDKTKDYWLCTCHQTKNIPFCDGSHKKIEVQESPIIEK